MSTQGQGDVVADTELAPKMAEVLRDFADQIIEMRECGTDNTESKIYRSAASLIDRQHQEIDRLRTLLSSSRGEQGWRSIDSAPKDGTKILAWWDGKPIITYWAVRRFFEGWQATSMMTVNAADKSAWNPTHWMPLPSAPGSVPTSLAGQGTDDTKEEAAVAYFRSAIADGQAAILLADLATYDNVLRELGIQESHKHPVDEVRRIQRIAETAHPQGVEAAAKLIDRAEHHLRPRRPRSHQVCRGQDLQSECPTHVADLGDLPRRHRPRRSAARPSARSGSSIPSIGPEGPELRPQTRC